MKTILIINGEKYWQDFFPDYKVVQKNIQDAEWILKNNKLYVTDKESTVQPDGILWRVGAIKPSSKQTTALNLIALSSVPCVNSAQTLRQGYDRLSMLSVLKASKLPIIDFDVVTVATQLKNIKRPFPFVVKAGNYHGGYGKVLVENEKQWQDTKDLLFISNTYITIEPYIQYERDIRYMAIKDKIWAMSRKGQFWKANVNTTEFIIIEPEPNLLKQTKQLQQMIKADIVAIDILEEANGTKYVVEYNDIPGLSGFSEELKYYLADCLKEKL